MNPSKLIEFAASLPVLNGTTPIIVPGGRDDRGGKLKITAYPQKKRKRFTTEASHLSTGAKIGGVSGAVLGAGFGAASAKIVNKAVGEKGGVVESALRTGRTGLITGIGLGALIGGAIKKSNERIAREKAMKRSKLFRQLHEVNEYERQQFGVTLLGIPEADFKLAEEKLTDTLGRALAKNLPGPAKSAQVRAPLPGPLRKYASLPNNPLASPSVLPNPPTGAPLGAGEWVDTTKLPSNAAAQPGLQDILAYLKKRNMKQVPIARSKGGRGWFPERGDIHDFAARLVDIGL
jgi:hypothetical protein